MPRYFDVILLTLLSFLFSRGRLEITTMAEILIPVVLALNCVYAVLAYAGEFWLKGKKIVYTAKIVIIILVVLLTVGKSFTQAVHARHLFPKTYPVHDNAIQIEQAAKYLSQGKNPYAENYRGFGMEDAWPENPAVNHVITMPFYLVFSAVILYAVNFFTGIFDERMVHLLVLLPVVFLFFKKGLLKKEFFLVFLILFLLNPLWAHFLISGRSDIFVYALLFFSFYFLAENRITFASLFFGLAFVSKQSSWLLFPLFFLFLYYRERKHGLFQKIKEIFKKSWIFFFVVGIFTLPFLLWNATAFLDGIYNFPAGTLKTSYPIMGYGFSSFLREMGWVKPNQYFPFSIFQIVFGAPVLLFCAKCLKRSLNIATLINSYAVFLFVFWFFSRFFLDNYVGFLVMLFMTAQFFKKI